MEDDPYSDEVMDRQIKDQQLAFMRLMGKMESKRYSEPSLPYMKYSADIFPTKIGSSRRQSISQMIDSQITQSSQEPQKTQSKFKSSFDKKAEKVAEEFQRQNEIEKMYGATNSGGFYKMQNKISCLDPITQQQEMLKGKYELTKKCSTTELATLPNMYYLYKRRDFEKKTKKAQNQDQQRKLRNFSHMLSTAITDDLYAKQNEESFSEYSIDRLTGKNIQIQHHQSINFSKKSQESLQQIQQIDSHSLSRLAEIRECFNSTKLPRQTAPQSRISSTVKEMIAAFVKESVESLEAQQVIEIIKYLTTETLSSLRRQQQNNFQVSIFNGNRNSRVKILKTVTPQINSKFTAPSKERDFLRSTLISNSQKVLGQQQSRQRQTNKTQMDSRNEKMYKSNSQQLMSIQVGCDSAKKEIETQNEQFDKEICRTKQTFDCLWNVQNRLDKLCHIEVEKVPECFQIQSTIDSDKTQVQREFVHMLRQSSLGFSDDHVKWYKYSILKDRGKQKKLLQQMRKQDSFVQNLGR